MEDFMVNSASSAFPSRSPVRRSFAAFPSRRKEDFMDFNMNTAGILLLLREGRADDLRSIQVTAEGSDPYLEAKIDRLRDAGLIEIDPPTSDYSKGAKIRLCANFARIQQALGFSLHDLAAATADTLAVQPYFGRPVSLPDPLDVFVLMPFGADLADVYRDHITNVTSALGLVAKRGDDFFSAHHVMSDIWRAIWHSRVIIADCTTKNANVFYEIGVAHTLGKPVILITQNDDDVPFDLRSTRYIKYEFRPRGMEIFEARLKSTIQAVLTGQQPTSPSLYPPGTAPMKTVPSSSL
jgi:hypothetical protein